MEYSSANSEQLQVLVSRENLSFSWRRQSEQ
jgi:hypothetical protein